MMMGTLSLVQKGQTSGHSGIVVYGGGVNVFGIIKGQSNESSGIVVYDGGNIVFGAKRSNQCMQWTQWNSSIW